MPYAGGEKIKASDDQIWLASWAMGTRECPGQVETEIYKKMICRNILSSSQRKLTSDEMIIGKLIFGRQWLSCSKHSKPCMHVSKKEP